MESAQNSINAIRILRVSHACRQIFIAFVFFVPIHNIAGTLWYCFLCFNILKKQQILGSWILANIIQKEGHDSQKSVAHVLQWLNVSFCGGLWIF
jgi:hypothetical protein